MKSWQTGILGAGLALMSVGCVGTTLGGKKVDVITNPELVKACSLKGTVESAAVGEENALNQLRNRASEMGANVILTKGTASPSLGQTKIIADVYACEN